MKKKRFAKTQRFPEGALVRLKTHAELCESTNRGFTHWNGCWAHAEEGTRYALSYRDDSQLIDREKEGWFRVADPKRTLPLDRHHIGTVVRHTFGHTSDRERIIVIAMVDGRVWGACEDELVVIDSDRPLPPVLRLDRAKRIKKSRS